MFQMMPYALYIFSVFGFFLDFSKKTRKTASNFFCGIIYRLILLNRKKTSFFKFQRVNLPYMLSLSDNFTAFNTSSMVSTGTISKSA